ncbi:MAG: tetraacyldisaccharide 4'-kinase [Dysgonamonadaceae bacterium]|nr:tetraacyldisaccharide 4'-kinase [Dysgonamonadaceae bacterium]MDD4728311.1 tetraacyldisaccharide 4'-kinase [Dysgonamonadaceae bacterium]
MFKSEPKIRTALSPLSWIYGFAVELRNFFFDNGILKQIEYPIPLICVGNLTVGGTGKTPHIEYVIQILSDKYKVAVVSRGYKRKSKSMQVVNTNSDVKRVGDEPLQIKKKYPEATVIVDRDRRNAIEYLLSLNDEEKPDVVLLDDGYQHRYVKPSLSILLVDSNRLIYEDKLLPAGRLREPLRRKDRAGIVIVTKCSDGMQPINFRIITNGLNLFPYQSLYFTRFAYQGLKPVFPAFNTATYSLNDIKDKQVLLVTGIASTKSLEDKLSKKTNNLHTLFFPDHHFFNEDDIKTIEKQFAELSEDKIVITTEKDAVRLEAMGCLSDDLKENLFFLPIEVSFTKLKENESFNKKIINHVRNYQKNSRLSKR